jgi:hypothetical protein
MLLQGHAECTDRRVGRTSCGRCADKRVDSVPRGRRFVPPLGCDGRSAGVAQTLERLAMSGLGG